ncbi:hypothetical protein DPEC_G00346080 [Dallia pectoralis]|uniref:Uncharacterized protein n=1 Tax=Dallia pectoralis TaxID=75939 RepID=A0ACC2F449_DALPE|nr:hypothetical protein DPEC_G00346080 [Dallia pectoralis]
MSLFVLVLMWRYWEIRKQLISTDHRSSDVPPDVNEGHYSMIDDRRGQRPNFTESTWHVDSQRVSVICPNVSHSQIDPTEVGATNNSIVTTAKRPEPQVETSVYAQAIKTKKKESDPVYSLLRK